MLLVETGSTKTSFAVIDLNERKTLFIDQIEGFNMMLVKEEFQITNFLNKIIISINPDYQNKFSKIEFYCAGCKTIIQKENLQKFCSELFKIPQTDISVYDDLLAAARATCKFSPGIVSILGTGSNSCLYDGKTIIQQISPLGFILGGEMLFKQKFSQMKGVVLLLEKIFQKNI